MLSPTDVTAIFFARAGLDKARQYAEGLNELEVKVEEATNSDKWGPHGSLMQGARSAAARLRSGSHRGACAPAAAAAHTARDSPALRCRDHEALVRA